MIQTSRSVLRHIGAALIVAALAAPLAAGPARAASSEFTTPSGLRFTDIKVGTGPEVRDGQTVTVNYTGWLYEDGKKGKKFDSSFDRKKPFAFVIGQGNVVKGWDEGVSTMRVGGKRTLIIPPELGYGEQGAGNTIPPNAFLIFEVEVLSAK
jgi:peptidylprolyl isomerase